MVLWSWSGEIYWSLFFEDKLIDIKIEDLGENSREMIIEGWENDSTGN